MGFDRLSRAGEFECGARTILRRIADDERRHDSMLSGLREALPHYVQDPAIRDRARQLHLDLSRGGAVLHLASIAGLDAAVCTILSRLLRPGLPLSGSATIRSVLSQIRGDETRHVLVSRNIALAAPDRQAVRGAAAEARAGLAELLACGADAFEALGVDPDRLVRDIAALPNGLLPR